MDRTSPEYLELVKTGAKELTLERMLPLIAAQQGPDGEIFGDTALEGPDFVAWFVDKQQRGIIDNLERLTEGMQSSDPNFGFAQRLRDEFDREFARMNRA